MISRYMKPLEGKTALVAGATRDDGRGIAAALGEAGATVWCTGRSVAGNPGMAGRPETIDETANLVTARGGRGISRRVDHTKPEDVARLLEEIGALDILVNDIWGGDELVEWGNTGDRRRSTFRENDARRRDRMPRLIAAPVVVQAAGNKPKVIEEFVGRPSTGTTEASVARMKSPAGWQEPGQRPEFREITVVLAGLLRVEHEGGALEVRAGQAVITEPGEWVRYGTPGGAEYVAVCLPAFAPDIVHRDPA